MNKPVSRNVNGEVYIQQLHTHAMQSEFKEMFLEMVSHDDLQTSR